METKLVLRFGLVIILVALLAACSGTTTGAGTESVAIESIVVQTSTPAAVTEEPTPVEVVNTQVSTASPTETNQPTPTENVATEESIAIGPRTGDIAPDFTLPDSEGNMVNLADELGENQSVILVFYFEYG
jgi:hypothetical protein